ncbi:hypothetical protein [Mucilaginibacter sp.]|uniref:hypothetical protein n=1 Tax=Mucilaginibacter sp. TaxID=1882438 RepID=UPI003D0C94D2
MKKIFIGSLALVVLTIVFAGSTFSQQKAAKEIRENDDWGNSRRPGSWDAVINGTQVHINFAGGDWNTGRTFMLAELGTLPPVGKAGTVTINREAGKLSLNGIFDNHWGHGTYKVEVNAAFKNYLADKGFKGLDEELIVDVILTDINHGYFDYLKNNGYASITNDEFMDLARQDLSHKTLAEYFDLFKAQGYGHQPLAKIIELHEHGVNAAFVNSFQQVGYTKIPLDNVLELRDHGVSPDFINAFIKIGYKNIPLDKATELRDHGVSPAYINSLQQMGYKDVSLDRAQDLRDHGVNPDFIKGIQALGFKNLSLDEAQELKDHGVSVAYIQKVKSKNLSNIRTLDDYIKLRDTGF